MKRLTWRREARDKGLARICQGYRGFELWYDGYHIGDATNLARTFSDRFDPKEFYWRVFINETLGLTYENTTRTPVASIEDAKEQCEDYVRKALGLAPKRVKKETEKAD